MHRRKFMQVVSSLCRTVPFWALTPAAFGQSSGNTSANANRKILVLYSAGGGLDPNAWCNPRNNPRFGRYATVTGPTDGPIVCAPMGDNSGFFSRHRAKSLIINGLDMQNSDHEGGKIAVSGRRGTDFPHLCELYAASIAQSPLPWITHDGHERGFKLVTRSEIPRADQFNKLFNPNIDSSRRNYIDPTDAGNIKNTRIARMQEMQRLLQTANGLPNQTNMLSEFIEASGLQLAANEISNMLGKDRDVEDIDVAMWAAKLGYTNSIEVGSERFGRYGFDAHENFVERYNTSSLPYMTKRLDQIWKLATDFGINNRVVVYVISEMGRKGFDEDNGNGKSHHSIGCATIMAEDIPGNRVIGASDADSRQIKIDFSTGRPTQTAGAGDSLTIPVLLQALRRYLGIDNSEPSKRFNLNNAKELDIMNRNIVTGYPSYTNPDSRSGGRGNRPAGFDY